MTQSIDGLKQSGVDCESGWYGNNYWMDQAVNSHVIYICLIRHPSGHSGKDRFDGFKRSYLLL